MTEKKDFVLIIDQDDDEREMLVEAALEPFGYRVETAADGGAGLSAVKEKPPDIIILDLHLEGLSGRDVMAALQAQSQDVPVILLANHGAEKEALQAFRLGAKDYLVRPFREAELIQAVERALKEVRLKRDRENLLQEVQVAAGKTQRHLRELKTLMHIGKSITTLRALNEVFQQVIRAAVTLTSAEAAGFFLRDDQSGKLVLRAGQNLSPGLAQQMGKPVADDLTSLVMASGETFVASGEGLTRYKPAQANATSVIYAPLVVHESAIGILWIANEKRTFEDHMPDLVTALADYAAIAVVNARLFMTMQEKNRQYEQMAKRLEEYGESVTGGPVDTKYRDYLVRLRAPLTTLLANMNLFRTGEMGKLISSHQAAVDVMHRQLTELIDTLDNMIPPDTGGL
nr:response regulator [Anaerolineae bacterium]